MNTSWGEQGEKSHILLPPSLPPETQMGRICSKNSWKMYHSYSIDFWDLWLRKMTLSTSFLAANSCSDLVTLHDGTGIVPLTPCKKINVVRNPSLGFRNRIQKKMCSMFFLIHTKQILNIFILMFKINGVGMTLNNTNKYLEEDNQVCNSVSK